MITIEHAADVLRGAVGVAAMQLVSPDELVAALDLNLFGTTLERPGLRGRNVVYDDTAMPEVQRYQIARSACAYALQQLNLLRYLSPHDLAVELCGVGSVPRAPRVTSIAAARRLRLRSGWMATS